MELYRAIPPPYRPPGGENTPMSVKPSHTDNFVPTEEEVNWVVRRLRGHRLGFPYRICAKHLWEWLQEHQAAEAAAEAKRLTLPEERGIERGGAG